MPRELSNVGASVRAKILNQAHDGNLDFQNLLQRYALERLLYRLSVSGHRDRFVLKGAMLFTNWGVEPFRSTQDLDLLGHDTGGGDDLVETFRTIFTTSVPDDGVIFDSTALKATPIRKELENGGVRLNTIATIASARVSIQVDVGFGDTVTPAPVEVVHVTLLKGPPAPNLWSYPVQTVVAEKLQALVYLGIKNSRLKDFYDLWWIAWGFEFRQSDLCAAVRRTFACRETPLPTIVPVGLSDEFVTKYAAGWRTLLQRDRWAEAPENFSDVVADLREFLLPVLSEPDEDRLWPPRGPWSTLSPEI